MLGFVTGLFEHPILVASGGAFVISPFRGVDRVRAVPALFDHMTTLLRLRAAFSAGLLGVSFWRLLLFFFFFLAVVIVLSLSPLFSYSFFFFLFSFVLYSFFFFAMFRFFTLYLFISFLVHSPPLLSFFHSNQFVAR